MPHYDTKKYTSNDNAARAAADDLQRDYPGQATAVIWTSPNVGYLHDQDDQFTSKDHFEVPNRVIGTTGYDALVMDTKKKSFTVEFYADRAKYTALCGDFIETKIGDKLLRYDFPSVGIRNWLQAYLPVIRDLPLRDVCVPKTHDSGMYKLVDKTFPGGQRSVCLTQSYSIYDQLQLGARRFNIRPFFWNGQWSFGHFSEINPGDIHTGKAWLDAILAGYLGWQGGIGASIEEIINDVNKFSSSTQELIILEISHITNLDTKKKLTLQDRQSILGLLRNNFKNLYHDPNPGSVDLADKKLHEYIDGRSSVLVIFNPEGTHDPIPHNEITDNGFFHLDRLQVGGTSFAETPTGEQTKEAVIYDFCNFGDEKSNPYSVYNLSKKLAAHNMPEKVKSVFNKDRVAYLEMNYLDNVDNFGMCLAVTLNRVEGKQKETIIVYGGSLITSPDIKAKIQAAIATKSNYLVSNDTLGGDPWCGVYKSCVVWYFDAEQKARFAREGEELRFSD